MQFINKYLHFVMSFFVIGPYWGCYRVISLDLTRFAHVSDTLWYFLLVRESLLGPCLVDNSVVFYLWLIFLYVKIFHKNCYSLKIVYCWRQSIRGLRYSEDYYPREIVCLVGVAWPKFWPIKSMFGAVLYSDLHPTSFLFTSEESKMASSSPIWCKVYLNDGLLFI